MASKIQFALILAEFCRSRGKLVEADGMYEQALKGCKITICVATIFANLFFATGRIQEAGELCRVALEATRRTQRAENMYEQLMKAHERAAARVASNLADVRFELGKLKEARDMYETALLYGENSFNSSDGFIECNNDKLDDLLGFMASKKLEDTEIADAQDESGGGE